MVSGGTYGTEEIVHGAGYGHGILILLFLPVLWCLPTAFMIGELSSALPAEGGYYAWVRRGLGNFWGFQEAWLSLAASIFDMAIYPTLFVFYLEQMSPWFGSGSHAVLAGLFVVVTCAILNMLGIRVVGITSLWLFFFLSAPFAIIVVMAPFEVGAFASAGGHGAAEATGSSVSSTSSPGDFSTSSGELVSSVSTCASPSWNTCTRRWGKSTGPARSW